MRRSEYGARRSDRDLDAYSDRPVSGYGYGGSERDRDRDAPPRKFGSRRDDPDEQKRKMFCGGLSLETTKDAVERYFTRFGPIQEVIMVPELVFRHIHLCLLQSSNELTIFLTWT